MRTYRIAQGTLLNVCGDLNGKEIQKGGGAIYVNVQLIYFAVWQKLTKYCKANILQQKLILKKKEIHVNSQGTLS